VQSPFSSYLQSLLGCLHVPPGWCFCQRNTGRCDLLPDLEESSELFIASPRIRGPQLEKELCAEACRHWGVRSGRLGEDLPACSASCEQAGSQISQQSIG